MSSRAFHRFLHLDPRGHRGSDPQAYVDIARRAEQRGFDAVVLHATHHLDENLGDPLDGSSLEPITVLSAVAAVTSAIGLIAPVITTVTQPYTSARRLSALDFVSSGRAGWQPVTSLIEAELANAGLPIPAATQARERAAEYVDVVTSLWHSWRPEARLIDKVAGVYLDLEQIVPIDYQGRHFQVSGPIDSPRPPQGNPILVTDENPDSWTPAIARTVDVVISDASSPETTNTAINGALEQVGRPRSEVLFLPRLTPDQIPDAPRLHTAGVIDGATLAVDARREQPTTALERFTHTIDGLRLATSTRRTTLRDRLGLPLPTERRFPLPSVRAPQTVKV